MDVLELPSIAEIRGSTDVLSVQGGCKVVKVRGMVVKYGRNVSLVEAETMRFVAAHTDVRVPKVLGTLIDPDRNISYIVMEFIEGDCLDEVWGDLTPAEQEDFKKKFTAAVTSLRQIPSQGYIGSLGRQKCTDYIFHTGSKVHDPSKHGPFANEQEMNEGMLRRLAEIHSPSCIMLYRAVLSNMPKHRIIFTHADLQARNIMVRRTHSDTVELTIIDWEMAGFYPEYWEFCSSANRDTFHEVWLDIVRETMEIYTNEYLWMQKVRQIIFW